MNKFTPFFININSVEVVAYSLGVPVVTMELNVSAAVQIGMFILECISLEMSFLTLQ